ncbi:TPA: helix-turn-helix transcriptional regulator [Escherichia coli]|uniref:LuxR C-terminal-related transcriptional regulator n=2 Tax=Escherichia coli TaxID=562 RepID=UPI000BB514C5|nr:hypothetical protein CNQ55_26145 [Escherichia coli]EAT2663285.1 LuxR family transcriptional regulator [Salmonella enterica]EFA8781427.1 LuxR family transcriptional regulator [Escherichia coli O105]EED0306586.1 LuxR family transcriptional regulator [Escherichia coli]EEU3019799.1 LuxR family transcriptional regulator [Escherichia coli]
MTEIYSDNTFFNIDSIIGTDTNESICCDGRKLIIIIISNNMLGCGSNYFCQIIEHINRKNKKSDINIIIFCRRRMVNIISDTVNNRILCLPYHSLIRGMSISMLKGIFLMSFRERNINLRVTPAEQRVIDLYLHGKTYDEISSILGIKPGTASIYKNKVIKRFGVSNELELFYKMYIINKVKD